MAEFGVAAHWIYKEGPTARGKPAPEGESKLKWLRSMLDWQQELQDPKEFMENLKVDLFDEEVFVFTPKGEVKSLAAGAIRVRSPSHRERRVVGRPSLPVRFTTPSPAATPRAVVRYYFGVRSGTSRER